MLDIQKHTERNNQFIRCSTAVDIQKCLKKKITFECQQVNVQVRLHPGKDSSGKKKGFGGKKAKQEKIIVNGYFKNYKLNHQLQGYNKWHMINLICQDFKLQLI